MVIKREMRARAFMNASRIAQTLKIGHVNCDECVDVALEFARGNQFVRTRKEEEALIHGIVVRKQARHTLALGAQGMRERKLRAQAVAIGAHMPAQGKTLEAIKGFGEFRKRHIGLRSSCHAATPRLRNRRLRRRDGIPNRRSRHFCARFLRCAQHRPQEPRRYAVPRQRSRRA